MLTERIRELIERTEALDPEPGWIGPVPEKTIQRVERSLGVRLPPSLREFIKQVGGGGPLRISGIHPENPLGDDMWPSVHHNTIVYRDYKAEDGRQQAFPPHLLVVMRDPEDHYTFCIDVSKATTEKEGPVVVYDTNEGSIETYAEDFPAFYERFLQQEFGGGDAGAS